MLLTADWVVPVSEPPIHHGAVLIRNSRIKAVGPLSTLMESDAEEPVHEFSGCTLMPGLVNAHTHLELSYMGRDRPPGGDFVAWLEGLLALRGGR